VKPRPSMDRAEPATPLSRPEPVPAGRAADRRSGDRVLTRFLGASGAARTQAARASLEPRESGDAIRKVWRP